MAGKNATTEIWIIHEMEGGSLVKAFTCEADAYNYFNHEENLGNLNSEWYKVSKLTLEDMGKPAIWK